MSHRQSERGARAAGRGAITATVQTSRCRLVSAATALLLLASPVRATWAQSDGQKQKALEHFQKASRYYDVARYDEAIEEYQKAYLNVEDPVFLYNIAQCYRLSNRPAEAVRFYRNYLRRAPNAPNRADVERRIADLEKLAAEREAGAGASATSPPAVTPGGSGEPAAPPPAPPPPPPVASSGNASPSSSVAPDAAASKTADEPGHGQKVAGITLLATGAALVVVSVISGSIAASKARDVEQKPIFDPKTESAGKAANGVAIVSGLVGVAAAVTGTILLLTRDTAPTAAAVGRSGLVWTPAVVPGGGTLVAGASF